MGMNTTTIRMEEIESYDFTPAPTNGLVFPAKDVLVIRTKSGARFLFEGTVAKDTFDVLNKEFVGGRGALTIGEES